MARYPESLLEEIRRAVTLSAVIGAKHKLRRVGAEFKGVDDESLTVNDRKGMWYDFGKGKAGGDIFAWFQKIEGLGFTQAVEEAAKLAGVALPAVRTYGRTNSADTRSDARAARNNAGGGSRDRKGAGIDDGSAADSRRQKTIIAYDYTDADGALIYQAVREEWVEKGKRRKKFFQRRRAPGEPGVWINSLGPGEFMRKGPGRDWLKYNEENFEKWRLGEHVEFDDEVAHTLYRLPAVREELLQGEEGATIFLAEGERDVHTLEGFGLVATTNSGGAGNWQPYHAELLSGADVIILADNDDAGRQGAIARARSLRGVARRVRLLDFRDHWSGCPKGGDVTDWRDQAGGNVDKLFEIIDKLPEWKHVFRETKFGRVRWRDHAIASGTQYSWLIKGLIPAGEPVLIYGESQSGKSFFAFDLAMHIASDLPFRGRRTQEGLIVYCAMEAGKGFRKRMRAYSQWHKLDQQGLSDLPFDLLTKKADLFSAEVDTDALIAEIASIADERDMPVAVVIIDTFNAATPGMKEIASEDVSRTNRRLDRIRQRFDCGIWVVHHKNAAGTGPRGHTSLYAGIETAIEIAKKKGDERDSHGRAVREVIVRKQREGEDNERWNFVLPAVEIGRDEDGDPITSCVVVPPHFDDATRAAAEKKATRVASNVGGLQLRGNEDAFFRALLSAVAEAGQTPSAVKLGSLRGVERVVDYTVVREHFKRQNIEPEEDAKRAAERVSKALRRGLKQLVAFEVVAADTPWIWPTGKRVRLANGSVWPHEAGQRRVRVQGQDAPDPADSQLPDGIDETSFY